MESWELSARESIRDLVARYNANGDSGRIAQVVELFADDAVMELPRETCDGRAAIQAMFERVATHTGTRAEARARFIRHFTATHQIDVLDEEEARGRCYYLVLTDQGLDHWGRYVDAYRRVDGRWLFARRTVSVDAAVPGAWAELGD